MGKPTPPTKPAAATATIVVRGLKVSTLILPGALPPGLVLPEPAPAGNPILELRWGAPCPSARP
jgi:hypothetical protein